MTAVTLPGATAFDNNIDDSNNLSLTEDPAMAVTPTTIVTATDATINWKQGTTSGSVATADFWGDRELSTGIDDTEIFYDAHDDQTVMTAMTYQPESDGVTAGSRVLIAVSANPGGGASTWYREFIDVAEAPVCNSEDSTFIDNPCFAISGDHMYIEGARFEAPPASEDTTGGNISLDFELYVMSKSALYAHEYAAPTAHITLDDGLRPVQPLLDRVDGSFPFDGDYLIGASTIAKVSPSGTITEQSITPPVANSATLSNPDSTNDSTNMQSEVGFARRPVWRRGNIYDADTIYPATSSSDPDFEQPTVLWDQWNVSNWDASSTPSVSLADYGTEGGEDLTADTTPPNGAVHAWVECPSITVNDSGDIALGFNAFGPNIYEGAYFAIHKATDPSGYLSAPFTLKATHTAYPVTGATRWGDSSDAAVDPNNNNTFWFDGLYVTTGGLSATEVGSYTDALEIRNTTNNPVELRKNPTDSTDVQVLVDGAVTNDIAASSFDHVIVYSGLNTVTVDETYGSPIPSRGIAFSAITGSANLTYLKVIGADSVNNTVSLDSTLFTYNQPDLGPMNFVRGNLLINGQLIQLTHIEAVEFDGGSGNDTMTLDESKDPLFYSYDVTFHGGGGTNVLNVIAGGANDLAALDDTRTDYQLLYVIGDEPYNDTYVAFSDLSQVKFLPSSGDYSLSVDGATPLAIEPPTGTGPQPVRLASLDIGAGAKAVALPASSHANRSVLVIDAGGLAINSTGLLDLYDNDLILKYSSGQGSTATSLIEGFLTTGLHDGSSFDWLGYGIRSTTAANDSQGATGLGTANNADTGYASFDGITLSDQNEVLVKYTYYGDTDLDGRVDGNDVSDFSYGTGTNWLAGDFDYNTAVNSDDLSEFGTGYGAFQSHGAL